MRFIRDERGQASILIGMCIASLCGMAALSVDVGMLFRAKRVTQNAADAAAIAGAMEMPYNDWNTAAKAASAQNGMTDGVNGVTVAVTNASSKIQVVVTRSAPTYFMKAFHLNSMNVSARAVAALGPGSGCIFTLNQSGVDVGLSGQGSLSMPDCGVVIDSSSAKGLSLTGGATISAKYIGIVGNYSDSSNSPNSMVPMPVTGITPVPNPLGFVAPPTFSYSSCVADPHPNPSGSQTVTVGPSVPGGTVCYNGLTVSGSGTVNFTPGTYVINGGFSSSGSATIQETVTSLPTTTQPTIGPCPCGETFYLAPPNGALSITGSGAVNLSAPTTGAYNGILFYQDPNDTNSMKFAGSSGSTIAGVVYAPSASLSLSGASGAVFYMNMVVNTLSISGNNTLQNYSKVNANTPLSTARLVE
jgi:Flp pilus assembly protein TadG